MSDSTTPTPPVAEALEAPRRPSRLALAAMIVGIVAIVFAIIPGLSFVAFIPALTALGLGIAALVSKAPARGMALTGVILGPIALIVAIIVSVAAVAGDIASSVDQAKPQPLVEAPDAPAVETPKPEAETPAEEGTRGNPAPTGSTIEISDASGPIWEVQIGAATLNAGDIVAAENQFNAAPDAGFQYLLVPVTYTFVGNESGTPWLDVTIEFVSAAGTTHTEAFVVIPNDYRDINEMYNGATATGNIVFMVPSADVEKGAFTISTFLSDPYFVKVV